MAKNSKKASATKTSSIEEELEAVLLRHGYQDWGFVVTGAGKKAVNIWCAGDGKPNEELEDRRRMGNIHFEMTLLQAKIIAYQNNLGIPKPAKPLDLPTDE